nr:hypothetical protein Iba_chr14fCG1890 [Ipomoea batatas]
MLNSWCLFKNVKQAILYPVHIVQYWYSHGLRCPRTGLEFGSRVPDADREKASNSKRAKARCQQVATVDRIRFPPRTLISVSVLFWISFSPALLQFLDG